MLEGISVLQQTTNERDRLKMRIAELEAQLKEAKLLLSETVQYTPDHMDVREWKARRDRLIKGIK